jgi:hypothetical protein
MDGNFINLDSPSPVGDNMLDANDNFAGPDLVVVD